MKLTDIIKTKNEIIADGHSIENNIIKCVDVNIVGHFGNCSCLEIFCENVCPMSNYNNTGNLGHLLRALVELMDIDKDNGIRIRDIKNVPCRLVLEGAGGWGSKCIGIGHFMKDRFVLIKDFVKVDE